MRTPRGRRAAAQPGAHHVRHRLDRRPAEPLGHGHGAGRLAATATTGRSTEERLLASVRSKSWGRRCQAPALAARSCPTRIASNPFDDTAYVGVPVAPFPRWMVCPCCRRAGPAQQRTCSSSKPDAYRPDQMRYVHANCTKPGKPPHRRPGPLHRGLQERPPRRLPLGRIRPPGRPTGLPGTSSNSARSGPSGEAADIYVQCDDLRDVPPDVATPSSSHDGDLPACRGQAAPPAGLRRGRVQGRAEPADPGPGDAAGGVEHAGSRSCSRPCRSRKLEPAEATRRPTTGATSTTSRARRTSPSCVAATSCGTSPSTRTPSSGRRSRSGRRGGEAATSDDVTDLKTPEWEVFIRPRSRPRGRRTSSSGRSVPPRRFAGYFEKVVLVERLREVRALVGFTRIESPGDYESPADFPEDQRMRIARGKTRPGCPPARSGARGSSSSSPSRRSRLGGRSPAARRGSSSSAHKQWRTNRGLEPARGVFPGAAVRAAALVRPRPDPPACARVRLHGGLASGSGSTPGTRGRTDPRWRAC